MLYFTSIGFLTTEFILIRIGTGLISDCFSSYTSSESYEWRSNFSFYDYVIIDGAIAITFISWATDSILIGDYWMLSLAISLFESSSYIAALVSISNSCTYT